MLLTPASVRPWLAPDSRNRRWAGHGAMLIRRQEALDHLYPAYGSLVRLGLGTLAWALGVGGAVLVGRGVAAGGEGSAGAAGTGLLLVATFLGGAVVATGSGLARAVAAWWTLATVVRADGGRVDATVPDPDTRRAHEQTVARDRATGAWELWRMPLLPRTLAALVLAGAAVVLLVQAVLGHGEASTPFASAAVRGQWLTGLVVAVVCLLTGALTASGLRRVHRARMHRAAHDEPPAPDLGAGTLAPAQGSGAIVAGEAVPRVRLADGRELGAGVTLVGRAPRPRPDERADALLAVADERLSSTHLTVRIDEGRAVVVDRGSTNGTVVHRSHGGVRKLPVGEPQELADGDVVVLGATILTVGEPADDIEHTVLRDAP